jgi:hypothetical protein
MARAGLVGRTLTLVAALLVLGVAGVAGQGSPAPSAFTIVGEWLALHDCQRIVPMLHDAGLDGLVPDAVVGNGLVPGVTDPTQLDMDDPCAEAVPRSHSHFFTADGSFGSRDYTGAQVDDGRYAVDGDILSVGDAQFRFSLEGDALTLEPELTGACETDACRFGNGWRLMVAMPGMTWVRMP